MQASIADLRSQVERDIGARDPPFSPITTEDIVRFIEPIVTDSLRGDVNVILQGLFKHVEHQLQSQEAEIVTRLWSAIQPALRLVQSTQEFLNEQSASPQ